MHCTKKIILALKLFGLYALGATACSSILSSSDDGQAGAPIDNPFGNFYEESNKSNQGVILRSRKGAQTVEVELPKEGHDRTNFVIPMTAGSFQPPANQTASAQNYSHYRSGLSDREIAGTFPKGSPEQVQKRSEMERDLGLIPSQNDSPTNDQSYLGSIDQVKILYRQGRYEAGLIEIDQILRRYPTDPRLHEMRGTLLDRMGQKELARQAWNQSLELEPNNEGLKRFLTRRIASKP